MKNRKLKKENMKKINQNIKGEEKEERQER